MWRVSGHSTKNLTFLEESGEDSVEPGLSVRPREKCHCSKKKRDGFFLGSVEKRGMVKGSIRLERKYNFTPIASFFTCKVKNIKHWKPCSPQKLPCMVFTFGGLSGLPLNFEIRRSALSCIPGMWMGPGSVRCSGFHSCRGSSIETWCWVGVANGWLPWFYVRKSLVCSIQMPLYSHSNHYLFKKFQIQTKD